MVEARLNAIRSDVETTTLKTNLNAGVAGEWINLEGHPREAFNKKYVIAKAHFVATQEQAREHRASGEASVILNELTLYDINHPFSPKPDPDYARPVMPASLMAYVNAETGETVTVEKLGEAYITLLCDSESSFTVADSHAVPVSQSVAGARGRGAFQALRHNEAVTVGFLRGHPDFPIVNSRLRTENSLPAYDLPDNKHISVWNRVTALAGGTTFNEINSHDNKGQEELNVYAGRDFNHFTGRNHSVDVNENYSLKVSENKTEHIEQDDSLLVDGARYEEVKKDSHHTVHGAMFDSVNGNLHVNVSGKVIFNASSFEFVVPGNSLAVTAASGVTISPSPSGAQASAAQAAKLLDDLTVPTIAPLPPNTSAALDEAVFYDLPMVEVCMEQTDGSCPLADCPCGKNQGDAA